MEKFFQLKAAGSNVRTEIIAGLTTFFTMAYIIIVNPHLLGQAGVPFNGVFVATILASAIGTLMLSLFAKLPYAQAPGMGLNAFFVFTVCFGMGFQWQEALAMVLICGVVGMIITATGLRKSIIKSIPKFMQNAIGGGIGLFIAYIGVKNSNFIFFNVDPGTYTDVGGGSLSVNATAVPALITFNDKLALVALFGLILTLILLFFKVKGAIFIGIIVTAIFSIPMGVMDVSFLKNNPVFDLSAIGGIKDTFGACFGNPGLLSLFTSLNKTLLALAAIFAFILTDVFDTIGTFLGTGRVSGIFDENDEKMLFESKGFKSKMEKGLFADLTATFTGAILGTSNVTTYVESAAGIASGGRTGLTSLVVAILFLLFLPFANLVYLIPNQATSAALIVVGVMMAGSFADIKWREFEEAAPAFMTVAFMTFAYSITYGIAAGFITYTITKLCKKQIKEVHPILIGVACLFVLNFLIFALRGAGVF